MTTCIGGSPYFVTCPFGATKKLTRAKQVKPATISSDSSKPLPKEQKVDHLSFNEVIWVWLKIKREGLRRCWSMFPVARVPVWVPVS